MNIKLNQWNGGEMPVKAGTPIIVLYANGEHCVTTAGSGYADDWSHEPAEAPGNIVAYLDISNLHIEFAPNSIPFDEFKMRFRGGWEYYKGDFYCVIDENRRWVDSAAAFSTAVYFALQSTGLYDAELSEIENFRKLDEVKYSIVHARFLKALYEAGEVK